MKVENIIIYTTTIILFVFLSVCFNKAQAAITEVYKVEQQVTIKIAPKSGLPKALCNFYDKNFNYLTGQIVTVVESYDDITLIEVNLYLEQHNKIHHIKCK